MKILQAESVQQLLEVLAEVRKNHRRGDRMPAAYQDAIRRVASKYEVTYQTIGDLCRRRLELLDIGKFRHLLEQWLAGDAEPLWSAVRDHSEPAARGIVDEFFGGEDTSSLSAGDGERTNGWVPSPSRAVLGEELRIRLSAQLHQRIQLATAAGLGSDMAETALALIEAGFQAKKAGIRTILESTLDTA